MHSDLMEYSPNPIAESDATKAAKATGVEAVRCPRCGFMTARRIAAAVEVEEYLACIACGHETGGGGL